jgi:hypothetical protein
LYNPYWYAPLAYTYPDYSYDWSDDPPPYRPDSSYEHDSSASYLSTPSANDDSGFNLGLGASLSNSGAVQNDQTLQPEASPAQP